MEDNMHKVTKEQEQHGNYAVAPKVIEKRSDDAG